ncbi:acyl carrier protein [Lentzea pudingi]|nr:acyl carrier protein [Lentzea pudingi]
MRVEIAPALVRELLSDPKIFPELPADLDEDTELALDSLGLVWFLHQLGTKFDLVIEPEDEHLTAFSSLRDITDHLNRVLAGESGDG